MKKTVKGELTAFLSLIFLLLLSLVGAVLESASIQVMKNERRADAGRAMASVFAEYQKELLEEYEIFAIDEGYETGEFSESAILNRLSYYGAENLETELSQIRYLTDQSGKGFFEQAVRQQKEKTGLGKVEEFLDEIADWKTINTKWETYEKEDVETSEELNEMLQESEAQLSEENNPIHVISDLKSKGILEAVLPESYILSQKQIEKDVLPSVRTRKEGTWTEEEAESDGTVFFNLYLFDQFTHALQQGSEEQPLSYELEYLLEGKESDKENLSGVLQTLCNVRFGVDYVYLLTDSQKQAEARAFAGTLCTLLTIPGITEVVTQAILLAWAYGEAVMDVRALVSGKKLQIFKTEATWKLSLQGLLHLNEDTETNGIQGDESGLRYQDYLRILLYLKQKSTLSMRALDLIESNLRKRCGKDFIRVDHCVIGLKAEMVCSLRRGITYEFSTTYEYQ